MAFSTQIKLAPFWAFIKEIILLVIDLPKTVVKWAGIVIIAALAVFLLLGLSPLVFLAFVFYIIIPKKQVKQEKKKGFMPAELQAVFNKNFN